MDHTGGGFIEEVEIAVWAQKCKLGGLWGLARSLSDMGGAYDIKMHVENNSVKRFGFLEETRQSIQNKRAIGEPKVLQANGLDKLQSLVISARSHGASDERDHLYVLLGLIEQSENVPLTVNYNLRFGTLYRNFVRSIIEKTASLTILGQCDSSERFQLQS